MGGIMKSEIIKVIGNELAKYPVKKTKISGKDYDLSIFAKDEDINIFEGFLFAEVEDKSNFLFFMNKYKPAVSGYNPRFSFILYKDKLLVKDYRQQNKYILKTINKINKSFLTKIKQVISEPTNENIRKLFDRSDMIEEFYILYNKSRELLLKNIKGISDEEKREAFIDNFMLQMLTLWYLQEREFFNNDTSYFITKYKDFEQKKLSDNFRNYYDFINYFFEKISNNVNEQFISDEKIGNVVVVGPAIFLNGNYPSGIISIPNNCFYKNDITDTLINTPAKKVSDEVPLLNLLDSRDWTDMDEYVLGSLYEKLITQDVRKKTGAYYTPEEVTSYICENSIKSYLVDRINALEGKCFNSLNEIISEGNKDTLMFLFQETKDIKILDPAVGSAHFMESAINVLLDIYETIWEKAKEIKLRKGMEIIVSDEVGRIKGINLLDISNQEQFKLYIKFFIIISKNIYGVDINKGALKVARARLFLSLAKHFSIKNNYYIRFPNVHFNLREGNSLIGYVELKDKPKGQATFDFYISESEGIYVSEPILVISELKSYLLETATVLKLNGNVIKEVEELNKILSQKSITWFDFEKFLWTKEKLVQILIVSLNTQYARPLHELLNRITALFNEKLDEKFAKEHNIDTATLKKTKTFHWMFEFPEVFLKKKGFDVIVGNPPYVRADVEDEVLILQRSILENLEEYETLFEKWDLFVPFIERSIRGILNNNAKFSFIVSDAICTVKYADKIRLWLAKKFHITSIDYFENFPVFIGVGIVPVILSVNKAKPPTETNKIFHKDRFNNVSRATLLEQISPNLFKKKSGDILEFELRNIEYFGDICFISKGMVPHSDEKTAKNEFKKEDLISEIRTDIHIKKYVEGKNISRYEIKKVRYIEWGTDRVPNKVSRPTFEELYQGKKIIRGGMVEGVIDNKDIVTNHSILIFKRFVDLKGINNRSIQNSITKHNLHSRKELEKLSAKYSYEYLLAVINSNFANRYLNAVRRHKLSNYFYPDDFRVLPIKKLDGQDVFIKLVNVLHFLYQQENTKVDFFDKQFLDHLIYEIYFYEKFYEDNLYQEPKCYLLNLVSKHLKPIEYDRWAELYWKKQLDEGITADEEKELQKLEEKNLQTINEIYNAIHSDEEIHVQIETIKKHEWVMTIESE